LLLVSRLAAVTREMKNFYREVEEVKERTKNFFDFFSFNHSGFNSLPFRALKLGV
jgi:hypothetical protein